MTYVPNTPESQPSPKDTQVQIQTNFAQYALKFAVNHTAINNSNQGDHEAVVMEKQANDPSVVNNLVALYCKDAISQAGTQPQLFARIKKFLPTTLDPTNAINAPMQLTYNSVNTAGPQYQSFLVGGLLFFFGSTNSIATTITLSPSPSVLRLAIAIGTAISSGGIPNNANTQITQPNKFKINSSNAAPTDTYFWLAIGVA